MKVIGQRQKWILYQITKVQLPLLTDSIRLAVLQQGDVLVIVLCCFLQVTKLRVAVSNRTVRLGDARLCAPCCRCLEHYLVEINGLAVLALPLAGCT